MNDSSSLLANLSVIGLLGIMSLLALSSSASIPRSFSIILTLLAI